MDDSSKEQGMACTPQAQGILVTVQPGTARVADGGDLLNNQLAVQEEIDGNAFQGNFSRSLSGESGHQVLCRDQLPSQAVEDDRVLSDYTVSNLIDGTLHNQPIFSGANHDLPHFNGSHLNSQVPKVQAALPSQENYTVVQCADQYQSAPSQQNLIAHNRTGDGGQLMVVSLAPGQQFLMPVSESNLTTSNTHLVVNQPGQHEYALFALNSTDLVSDPNGDSTKFGEIQLDSAVLTQAITDVILPIEIDYDEDAEVGYELAEGEELHDEIEHTIGEVHQTHRMQRPSTQKGKRPYRCDILHCGTRFQDKSHLYRHIQTVHKLKIIFIDSEGNEEQATEQSDVNRLLALRQKPQSVLKNERRFPCSFPDCRWTFTRANHVLRHHQRVHPGFKSALQHDSDTDKPYSCDSEDCDQRFKTLSLLTRHKRAIHQNNNLYQAEEGEEADGINLRSCPKKMMYRTPPEEFVRPHACHYAGCGYRFTRKDHLTRHIERIHEKNKIRTGHELYQDEDQEISTEGNLIPSQKPRRAYVCNLDGCTKSYTKHSHLARHKIVVHKTRTKVKSVCEEDDSTRTEAETPLEAIVVPQAIPPKDLDERPFQCTFPACEWSFKRSYHLDRHMESHQRRSRSEHLEVSVEAVDGESASDITENAGPLSLQINGTDRKGDWNLRVRKKREEPKVVETIALAIEKDKMPPEPAEKRPFLCPFPNCDRRFKKKNHLDAHGIVHSSNTNREAHKFVTSNRIVTSERDQLEMSDSDGGAVPKVKKKRKKKKGASFACDIKGCDKTFSRNCELTRHKLNHSDDWPFVCSSVGCDRKFKRRDIFRNHLKTHDKDLEDAACLIKKAKLQKIELVATDNTVSTDQNGPSQQQAMASPVELWNHWDAPNRGGQSVSMSLVPVVTSSDAAEQPLQQVTQSSSIASAVWSDQSLPLSSSWIPLNHSSSPTVLETLGLRRTISVTIASPTVAVARDVLEM